MSESDSFIHEVSEAVRRDRLFGFLRRWGWAIGAALLLVVGGAAANEWRKARAEAAAEAAGDALRAALLEPDAATRAERLAALAEAGPGAPLARLARAGSLAEAGDRQAAAAALAELADDGAVPELLRGLAALQRVALLGPDMDPSERTATIEALAAPGAPFRPLALEQRALMRLEAGERDAALADLEAVLADPGTPEALADRARRLIVAAGGALPLGAAPAADG